MKGRTLHEVAQQALADLGRNERAYHHSVTRRAILLYGEQPEWFEREEQERQRQREEAVEQMRAMHGEDVAVGVVLPEDFAGIALRAYPKELRRMRGRPTSVKEWCEVEIETQEAQEWIKAMAGEEDFLRWMRRDMASVADVLFQPTEDPRIEAAPEPGESTPAQEWFETERRRHEGMMRRLAWAEYHLGNAPIRRAMEPSGEKSVKADGGGPQHEPIDVTASYNGRTQVLTIGDEKFDLANTSAGTLLDELACNRWNDETRLLPSTGGRRVWKTALDKLRARIGLERLRAIVRIERLRGDRKRTGYRLDPSVKLPEPPATFRRSD